MGTLFSFLIVRIALIVIGLTSVSMTVATAIASNQPPFDPFEPYADIMPGQPRQAVIQRGFHCEFTTPPSYQESCVLTLETGAFAQIHTTIAYETGMVDRVAFIIREQTLVIGHLARLWGQPLTKTSGHMVNFR